MGHTAAATPIDIADILIDGPARREPVQKLFVRVDFHCREPGQAMHAICGFVEWRVSKKSSRQCIESERACGVQGTGRPDGGGKGGPPMRIGVFLVGTWETRHRTRCDASAGASAHAH